MDTNKLRTKYCICEILFILDLSLEHTEGLLSGLCVGSRVVGYNIEPNSLAQRTALSNGNNITLLYIESRRAVSSNILVPLLKTTVLDNVMKVVPTNNNGTLHLGGHDHTSEDTSTDGYVSSEGALLVNVVSLNGSIGGLDSETDGLGETHGFLTLDSNNALAGYEYGVLALVSLFVLITLIVRTCDANHLRHVRLFIDA